MPVHFVSRSHIEGPAGKHVQKLEAPSVLAWFQSVWAEFGLYCKMVVEEEMLRDQNHWQRVNLPTPGFFIDINLDFRLSHRCLCSPHFPQQCDPVAADHPFDSIFRPSPPFHGGSEVWPFPNCPHPIGIYNVSELRQLAAITLIMRDPIKE